MNKQLRMAGLVMTLGLVLGFGFWQQPGSAAGAAENTLRRLIAPAAVNKGFSPKPRLASAKALNTITVTSFGDGPAIPGNCPGLNCRLRDAIAVAADGDTIDFSVTGTIILNSGQLGISKNLIISGPGAGQLTISGNNAIRVFNISSGLTAALNDLTIANGYGGPDGGGGGIKNSGILTLTNCSFLGNRTYSNGGPGGGISNYGTLTVTGSTLSGSTAGNGGGIYNQGSLTLISSTLSSNSAAGDGGGIYSPQFSSLTITDSTLSGNTSGRFGGGISLYFSGSGTMTNSTLSNNSAGEGGGINNYGNQNFYLYNCTITSNSASKGGGLWNYGVTVLRNTIIAGNSATSSDPDIRYEIGGITSLGHNLVGIRSFTNQLFPTTGDQFGTAGSPINPLLAPLAHYGGPTQTHALLPGSPALNAGNNCVLTNTCASNNLGFNLTNDQRGAGFNRQISGAVDIGAFESGGFTLAISGGDNQSTNTNTDFANPLAVTVSANGSGEPVQGGQVTFTPPTSGASATVAGSPATVDSGGTATSGIVTANATPGSYNVQAGGPGLDAVSFNLTNIAPCSTLIIIPAAGALPSGTYGTNYSQQFTQSGSAGPITWGITPAIVGLSINSTGLLAGQPIAAGTYNFDITATDANNCLGSASYSLVIAKANQTLTFGALANKTYGDAPFTVSAAASSGLLPSFSAAGNCTVSGGTVTLTGAGSCTITASQPGDANYNAAPPVAQSFTIATATATLTLGNLNQTYDGSPKNVTVTTSPAGLTGVSVTYDSSATAPTNAGSYAVVASLTNGNYQATNATDTLVIAKADQTITFGALANKTFGDAPFTVSATASTGLPVSFSATGNCTGSGNTVTITGAGSCAVTAAQAGNANYNAAANVTQIFAIAKASQTITFGALASKTYGDAPFAISATASSGLPVSFTASGSCTISGSTVTITGASSCTVTASQAGNTNYNAAPSVSQSFTIAKATATLTLSNLNQVYTGAPRSVTVTTSPAGLSGVNVTYNGSATAPTNVGSYAVVASLNNANYQAANVTNTLVIAKGNQTITFGTLANKVFGDAPFTVSATASSGLAVSFSATGNCTMAGNTVTLTGAGSCTITASQAGDSNWNAAVNVARSFTIAKANQTITFGALANKTYGDPSFTVSATATSGLAVSFSATGNCTVTNNTVSLTGAGTCTITASQAGNNDYNAATNVAQIFTIAKATAALTLSNLNQVYNGSARSVTVTTSPANLTGVSVTYNGSTTAPTNAGSYAVVASLTNGNYQATNATGTLVIAKADQTITFAALTNKTFGDAPFTVSATASTGLPVSFSAIGNCTVSGSTVTITGAGSCSVTAAQAGNTNYNAAANVTQSFTIAKANQTITFGALASKTYGDAPFAISATASSGLPVSFSAIGNCTVSGSTVTITGAGSCTVTASQAGNANYNAAANVQQSFTIAKATATLTLSNLNQVYTGAPRSVTVTTNPANLTGVTVTYNGATMPPTNVGSYAVVASLTNANYQAANVTGTLVIAKGNQTIRFNALANKVFGDAPFTVSATASSGLAVSFSATGNCTLAGNTVTLTGAGSCTITASQAGDANWNAAANVAQSFTIAKANQTITFAKLADKTYGDAPFKVSATASSGLTISFTASGACTVSLSTVTLTGAGTCTITATQAGNTNYNAATPVSQSFAIAKANQAIAFAPLPDKTYGDPSFKISATASSGLAVSFAATGSCTVSGNTVTLTAVGSCTITASQAGNANYNAALPVSQTFAVKYPCQPITFGITSLPVGAVAANYSVTLLPKALAPFQFTVSGLPSGLTASITTTTVTIAGIPSQAGTFPVQINVVDANGCTNAGANNFSLVINKGTPYVVWFTPAAIYCGTPLGNPQLNALVAVSSTDKRRLAGTIVYTPPAGTVLSPGSQTLSMVFTPTDTANWNTATASVILVVLQKPYITLNANGTLTSNDHQYYTLTMDRMVAGVTDGCATLDKNSVVVITQVTSDEPDDITKVGRLYTDYPYDGHTTDDIVIAADCKSVQLRDERDTRSDGRVYTISLRITGNSAAAGTTAVFKVTLPVQGQPFVESTVKNTVYSNCR